MTILAFFLFIAPGLLFDWISAYRKVPRKESTFTEISRVALVSTACSVAAFLTLLLCAALLALQDRKPFPVPSAMLKQPNTYIADNLVRVSVTMIVIAGLAMVFAWLLTAIVHHGDKGKIFYESTWHRAFREYQPTKDMRVHVRVTLTDGTIWFGCVRDFSPDMEVLDRELILQPPILCKPTHRDSDGNRVRVRMPERWKFVILRGAEIVSIAVAYAPPLSTMADQGGTPLPPPAETDTAPAQP
ncbi:DUF6338 family protein [Nocardia alba]|uniref:DUF6338 family protein n=1 Tax=Nocardia alba TaxID=225051 RepID=UPI00104B4EAF|nr:DUF6338 family protein [Nocardia alba]